MKDREVRIQKALQRLTDIVLVLSYLWTIYAIILFLRNNVIPELFFNLLIVSLRYFFIPLDPASEEALPSFISRDAVFASYLRYMISPKFTSFIGKFYIAIYRIFPGVISKFICKCIGFSIASIHMIINGYLIMIYQTIFTLRNRRSYKEEIKHQNKIDALDDHELKKILEYEDYKQFKQIESEILEPRKRKDIENYSVASYQFFKRKNKGGRYEYPPIQRYLQVGDMKAFGEPVTKEERPDDDLVLVVRDNGRPEYENLKTTRSK